MLYKITSLSDSLNTPQPYENPTDIFLIIKKFSHFSSARSADSCFRPLFNFFVIGKQEKIYFFYKCAFITYIFANSNISGKKYISSGQKQERSTASSSYSSFKGAIRHISSIWFACITKKSFALFSSYFSPSFSM